MMIAAQHGRLDAVNLLVNHGAKVNARDEDEMTAMMWAALGGYLGVVKFLAEHGAEIDARNNRWEIAATIARKKGHNDIADYLDQFTQLKERDEKIINSMREDSEHLTLKQDIQRILRTGQEYNAARHGVGYVA